MWFRWALAGMALLWVQVAGAAGLIFPPDATPRFSWHSFHDFAAQHDLSGQSLTITGPWTGADKEAAVNVFAYFEAATGARVAYAGSDSFEQDIMVATRAGTPPDLAAISQPGLVAALAGQGHLAPLGPELAGWMRGQYATGESWVDLGTHTGPEGPALYSFLYKAELKSLVWYVPDNFAEAGYRVPETLQGLRALTRQIVSDGGTPWCIGLGSGAATGWPATDWVEDLLLRRAEPWVYDAWARHALPFDDPRVLAAIEDFGWFARTPGHAAGGAAASATTDFRDSPAGLFSLPPKCYLHRQASFITSFFPEGVQLGRDVDFFSFPADPDRKLGRPVMGSGVSFVITRDSPAARAFLAFLQTPIAHELWMAQSGFLSPHKGANPAAYADDSLRRQGEILLGASVFRFDGSDLMPPAIGADAFWLGMVDYIAGTAAAYEVARKIEARWQALSGGQSH